MAPTIGGGLSPEEINALYGNHNIGNQNYGIKKPFGLNVQGAQGVEGVTGENLYLNKNNVELVSKHGNPGGDVATFGGNEITDKGAQFVIDKFKELTQACTLGDGKGIAA